MKAQYENFMSISEESSVYKDKADELADILEQKTKDLESEKSSKLSLMHSKEELLGKMKLLQNDNDELSIKLKGLKTENDGLIEKNKKLEGRIKDFEDKNKSLLSQLNDSMTKAPSTPIVQPDPIKARIQKSVEEIHSIRKSSMGNITSDAKTTTDDSELEEKALSSGNSKINSGRRGTIEENVAKTLSFSDKIAVESASVTSGPSIVSSSDPVLSSGRSASLVPEKVPRHAYLDPLEPTPTTSERSGEFLRTFYFF